MNPDNIPQELKELKQWVCVKRDSKVPMLAWAPRAASASDFETWSTFGQAVDAVKRGRYDNIGFVFNSNDFVGIDIDAGYDEDGFITEMAAEIIGKCQSYTEHSRSGRGFHIIVKGKLPFRGKNNLNGVEIYQSGRYFIMTGDCLLYNRLSENQPAIDFVVEKYFTTGNRLCQDNRLCDGRIYCPIWQAPAGRKIRLRPIYPRIPQGSRNICLTSLAGMLHNQGYSKDAIWDELNYCNKSACDPCLDPDEITSIICSVTRYKR